MISSTETKRPAQILVIWDDKDITNMFALVLEDAGYTVQSTHSCDDGLAACLRQPPDILIVSRLINGQNKGLEFCQRIRAIATLPHFPIIVGNADIGLPKWQDAYQQAYDAGANACFGQVFDVTDVLEHITTLLANPALTHLVDRQTLQLSQRTMQS